LVDWQNEAKICRKEAVGGDSRRRGEEAKKGKAEWAESFPWFGMDPRLDRQ
jgi:hypothetical protein